MKIDRVNWNRLGSRDYFKEIDRMSQQTNFRKSSGRTSYQKTIVRTVGVWQRSLKCVLFQTQHERLFMQGALVTRFTILMSYNTHNSFNLCRNNTHSFNTTQANFQFGNWQTTEDTFGTSKFPAQIILSPSDYRPQISTSAPPFQKSKSCLTYTHSVTTRESVFTTVRRRSE